MKMLIYITNNVNHVYPILSSMMEQHLGGASVVDCEGMLRTLSDASSEPPSIFGSLRAYLNPTASSGKMIFAAMKDEDVPKAVKIIHSVAGNLKEANHGVLFSVPIDLCEITEPRE